MFIVQTNSVLHILLLLFVNVKTTPFVKSISCSSFMCIYVVLMALYGNLWHFLSWASLELCNNWLLCYMLLTHAYVSRSLILITSILSSLSIHQPKHKQESVCIKKQRCLVTKANRFYIAVLCIDQVSYIRSCPTFFGISKRFFNTVKYLYTHS